MHLFWGHPELKAEESQTSLFLSHIRIKSHLYVSYNSLIFLSVLYFGEHMKLWKSSSPNSVDFKLDWAKEHCTLDFKEAYLGQLLSLCFEIRLRGITILLKTGCKLGQYYYAPGQCIKISGQ